MAFSGDSSVGLLFRIGADSSQAAKELSDFRKTVDKEVDAIEAKGKNAFTDFTQGLGLSAEQTAALSTALPVAGAAIGGFVSVVAGAGAALFSLAKNFADYGSKIKDASDKTGLTAESLSTLKLAAEQSGSSLDAITGSVTKFSKLIGDSAEGSKKATASLLRLGLDPKTAINDLDKSLESVFTRIYEAQNPIVATKLATEAFGKSGADLIPVIKQMDGDFGAFRKRAEELGVVLSGDDVKAADDFGDQLTELETVAKSVANTFAKEFTPEITSAMGTIEKLLVANKGAFKEWGQYVGDIIRGVSTPEVSLPTPEQKSGGGLLGARPSWFPSDEKIINFLLDHSATGGIARTLSGENAAKRGKDLRERADAQAQYDDENVRAGISNSFDKNSKKIKSPADDLNNGVDPTASAREKAANKAAAAAEKARREQIEAQEKFDTASKAQFEQAFGALSDLNKRHYEEGTISAQKYYDNLLENERQYLAKATQLAQNEGDSKSAAAKNAKGREAVEISTRTAIEKINADSNKRIFEGDKILAAAKQKDIHTETAEREALNAQIVYKLKENLAKQDQNRITQSQYDAAIRQNEANLLQFEIDQLTKESKVVQNNADIKEKIRLKEIERDTVAPARNAAEDAEKELEANKLLLEVKRQLIEDERKTLDFRKEQERKTLENTVDFSSGKARLDALVILRGFDIEETERHRKDALDNADLNEKADKEKVKGLQNEKELVEQITQDYIDRREVINGKADGENKKTNTEFNPAIKDQKAQNDGGAFFGTIAAGIGDYLKNVDLVKNANGELEFSFNKLFQSVGEIGLQAFTSLAQGFGQMVGNWVLYGNTGGQTLRKLAATILSQVASIATSYAVISLGAAALSSTAFGAVLLGGTPAQFLAAAAIFGGIALGSALIGRGLAGNSFSQDSASSSSFKSQTATGTGSGTNAQKQGSGEAGGYYSSESETRTFEEDRLRSQQPNKQVIEIHLKSNDSHIVNTVKQNIKTLGDIHSAVVKVVNAT